MAETERYVPVWQQRPSLQELQQEKRATPKCAMTTRLQDSTKDDKDDKVAERQWRKEAIARDGYVCRCCGRKVVKQLAMSSNRLEVHHIAPRADKVVRWDVRNGIVLCADCHEKVTPHNPRFCLFILQIAKHLFAGDNGKTYINGSKKVTFSERQAA